MPSTKTCSVFGCQNTSKKASQRGRAIRFYSFPTKEWLKERRKVWIWFTKRKGIKGSAWTPSKWAKICSDHFVGGIKSEDPRSPSYNPTIFSLSTKTTNSQVPKIKRYKRFIRREREKIIKPSLLTNENTENCDCLSLRPVPTTCKEVECQADFGDSNGTTLDRWECNFYENDACTWIQQSVAAHSLAPATKVSKWVGDDHRTVCFGGYKAIINDKQLIDMTSISKKTFEMLLFLLPTHKAMYKELGMDDKLLITLIKLKTGLPFSYIAVQFGIDERTVSKIFKTTISHLYIATQNWVFFPSKTSVKATLPESFKPQYSTCRVIIDCTEVRTETPPTIEQRIHMYSSYKGCYTAKFLIGITPRGYISFISKGYGGRATDSFITNDCGLLNLLEEGDTIMADKGFPNIQNKDGVLLVMPPFASKRKPQFTHEEVEDTYKIASVRIHVERAIQRLKIFKVLGAKVPVKLIPMLDQIIHICAALVNVSSPLIKE